MSAIRRAIDKLKPDGTWGFTGTGPPPTDDLTIPTRDALFDLQITSNDGFEKLTEKSLLEAKICETAYYARSVLRSCHSIGLIDPNTGRPDTTKIDKSIVSKIAIISVPKQRELVNMLFFWEEELVRWDMLCSREKQISEQIEDLRRGTGGSSSANLAELELMLHAVQVEKKIVPSARDDSGRPLEQAELPGYTP